MCYLLLMPHDNDNGEGSEIKTSKTPSPLNRVFRLIGLFYATIGVTSLLLLLCLGLKSALPHLFR